MASDLDSASDRKARLRKSYDDLEAQREVLSSFLVEWKEMEEHYEQVESELNRREEEISEKEQELEVKIKQTEERLSKREAAVQGKEKASLARVQEKRDSALAAIAEERKKLLSQKGGGGAKQDESRAGVSAKDEKEKSKTAAADKTTAAAAAAAAAVASAGEANGVTKSAADVSDAETPAASGDDGDGDDKDVAVSAATAGSNKKGRGGNDGGEKKVSAPEVRVRPVLKAFCEANDGEGLRKFIVQNRKDVGALRFELPVAMQMAIDPPRLVLDALEGYFIPDPPMGGAQNRNDNRREGAAVPASRRACILLLECLFQSLADSSSNGPNQTSVPANVQKTAKEVADEWRSRMDENEEGSQIHALDCQAFLQLVATYGIASQFSTDELFNLITLVARRKQSPAMCRSLGMAEKIPDLVDKLAKTGKQVEALAFAHEFGIMDKINPAGLLKTYLRDARKLANTMLKNGNHSAQAQNDAIVKELSALRNVVRCINEYKLESQVSCAPYLKHMQELEKVKSDRKRQAVAVKAQAKRPRVTASIPGKSGGAGNNFGGAAGAGAAYQGAMEPAYASGGDRGRGYGAGSAGILDRRTGNLRPLSGSNYGIPRSRSPISVGGGAAYVYRATQEAVLGAQEVLYGASYGGGQPAYGAQSSYPFAAGSMAPPPGAYQQAYLH